jgi:Na+/pantothenate symporter
MTPSFTSLIVLLVTALGFAYYVSLAQKRKSSRVEEFFQAGRNIGVPLFTQTTWGSSFAFGNSIFYAAWLGYTMGLSALWIQGLWALGMCCYALLIPRLIVFTENHTLHGFLGSRYGATCRIAASLVSVVGLLICLGFEISFAAQYFARATNIRPLEWLVVAIAATFVATFCSIGGFRANSVTDRLSNYLAFTALVTVLGAVVWRYREQLGTAFTPSVLWASATDFSQSSGPFLGGLACFALFNVVDMTNWQTVSSNSLDDALTSASVEQRRKMRRAMFRAAGLFLVAPVILGTLIGYVLRVVKQGTEDQANFMWKLVSDVLPSDPILATIGLSLLTFAFMASSLAGTDSWLLATGQTLSWDLFDYKKFKSRGFRPAHFSDETHDKITSRARWILMVVGVIGACVVYYVSTYVWKDIFQLQFVIFGGGLAMLPPLLHGIFSKNPPPLIVSVAAVGSIIVGYASAIGLFSYSLYTHDADIVSPLPMVSLGVSAAIFYGGLVVNFIHKRLTRRGTS